MIDDTLDLEVEELPRRPRRKLVTPVGIAAAAVAVAALGFLGGVQAQKSRGGSGTPAVARFGGTGGRVQQPQPGGAEATVGTVSDVDGSTLYVDGSDGTTVKVKLAKGGTVTRTATSQVKAIHPGDTVVVQGETASSGTVVASSIRATASNAGGGGFGGAPGAAPGGG
ncbi:MAG TPA: hypothetical protein VNS09_26960 [Solirubrobacter sp.]|nr:hypothetical protein [Solirubrobacter sp.]